MYDIVLALLGGLSHNSESTEVFDNQIIKYVGKKEIKILLIPFAVKNINYYYEICRFKKRFSNFKGLNIDLDILNLGLSKIDRHYINKKFLKSDIIWFIGGDPMLLKFRLNSIFKGKFLDNILSLKGKIIVGNSAGALIFFNYFVSSKETSQGNYAYSCNRGFGFLPYIGICHFSEWGRHHYLLDYVKNLSIDGIGIDEHAGYFLFIKSGKIIRNQVISFGTGKIFVLKSGSLEMSTIS